MHSWEIVSQHFCPFLFTTEIERSSCTVYTHTHTHSPNKLYPLPLFCALSLSFLSFSSNLITHYNFALPFNQIFIVKEERQKKAKIRRHFGHFMRMDGAYTHCQNEYTPFTFVGQSNFLSSFSLPLLSRYIYKRIKVYKLTHLQRKIGVCASNFSQIRFIIKKIHKTIYLNKMFRKSWGCDMKRNGAKLTEIHTVLYF